MNLSDILNTSDNVDKETSVNSPQNTQNPMPLLSVFIW